MTKYTEEMINSIWEKATPDSENNPLIWRKDFAGAWIRKDHFGKTSEYGWEIDHLRPVSQGGTDDISNLIPMNWRNNRKKADNYPLFLSEVTSSGVHNIERENSWRVNQ